MKSDDELQREINDLNVQANAVTLALSQSVEAIHDAFMGSFRQWNERQVKKYIRDIANTVCRGDGASLSGLRASLDEAYGKVRQRYHHQSLLNAEAHEWPHVASDGQSTMAVDTAVDDWFGEAFKEMSHYVGEALTKQNWLFQRSELPKPWAMHGSYIYPGYRDGVAGIVNGFAEVRKYKRELHYRASLRASAQRKHEHLQGKRAEAYWLKACQVAGEGDA